MSVTCDMSVVFSEHSGFLHQYNWPPWYNWNIFESGIKHHKPNPISNRLYPASVLFESYYYTTRIGHTITYLSILHVGCFCKKLNCLSTYVCLFVMVCLMFPKSFPIWLCLVLSLSTFTDKLAKRLSRYERNALFFPLSFIFSSLSDITTYTLSTLL